MSESNISGFGTLGQAGLLAAILIFVIVMLTLDNGAESKNQLERTRPIVGVIVWENKLCSKTLCKQELKIQVDDSKITIFQQSEPYFSVGQKVQLIKVFKEQAALFNMAYKGSWSESFYYEIFHPDS